MLNFNVSVYFFLSNVCFCFTKNLYKMVDFFCVILTIVEMLVVRVCFFVAGLGIAGLGMGRLKFGLGWAKILAWLA